MKLAELRGKKILIVGKGIEGMAVLKFLKRRLAKTTIDIVDQKDGSDYLEHQTDYDLAVKSPGVHPSLIKIPYTTATNIFLSNARGKVIGVTGTKGKSTTATLIYEMLKKEGLDVYIGGNIGQSALVFLDKLNDQPASPPGGSWTVLELSSFQAQDLKVSPHIAVILMITSEHLDYHHDIDDYVQAKRNILRFQKPEDLAIVNKDYPASHESDIHTEGQVYHISREQSIGRGCFVRDKKIWIRLAGKEKVFAPISEILLKGRHNLENICAAIMAAVLAGVSKASITSVLKTFKGLPHRLEFVEEVGGVRFYNDSLATIPEATAEALKTLGEDVTVLIVGGHDRGQDFHELAAVLAKSNVKTLILFPKTGERIWKAVCKALPKIKRPQKFNVASMKEAVSIAARETKPGDICLLSPASASFGLFKNYKDRGEQFKEEVQRLASLSS